MTELIWVHSAQFAMMYIHYFPHVTLIETRDKTWQDKLVTDSCVCIWIFFAVIYNNWVHNCMIAWLPLWKGSDPFLSVLVLYTLFRYMLFSYCHYLPFFFSLVFWIILVGSFVHSPASLNVFKSVFSSLFASLSLYLWSHCSKNIILVFPSAVLYAGFMMLNFEFFLPLPFRLDLSRLDCSPGSYNRLSHQSSKPCAFVLNKCITKLYQLWILPASRFSPSMCYWH